MEAEEIVRDFLNGDTSLNELCSKFDLEKCENCDRYELSSNLIDTEGLVNGGIGNICESCYNDLDREV